MEAKFIEAIERTNFNWGKFAVCRFTDEEWTRRSALNSSLLLSGRGWSPEHVLVLDLATGESAIFLPHGSAQNDLEKHQIWVCPMFEPFLAWLYQQDLRDLQTLPSMVNLGDVPTAMRGYRREGPSDDVWAVLDLIATEFESDPHSVQCFDLRLVQRAIRLNREHKQRQTAGSTGGT